MNIGLIGAAASGKGTQAALLRKDFGGIPHIAAGDMFRAHIKQDTSIGLEAKSYISKGERVPDKTTNRMIEERFNLGDCGKGFILDGYPRSMNQVLFLTKLTKLDVVIQLNVSRMELYNRLKYRLNCVCGKSYNVLTHNMQVGDKCPSCGEPVFVRADDVKDETVNRRLNEYDDYGPAMAEYYDNQGILVPVKVEDWYQAKEHTYPAVLEGLAKMGIVPGM